MVSYFVPGQIEYTKNDAFGYAAGIVLTSVVLAAIFHPFMLWIFRFSVKMRIGLSGLIYQKTVKITKSSIDEEGVGGNVINIWSNDLMNIEQSLVYTHEMFRGPVEIIVFAYFIYLEMGTAGLIGVAFLTCFVPLQGTR